MQKILTFFPTKSNSVFAYVVGKYLTKTLLGPKRFDQVASACLDYCAF